MARELRGCLRGRVGVGRDVRGRGDLAGHGRFHGQSDYVCNMGGRSIGSSKRLLMYEIGKCDVIPYNLD